MITKKQAPKVDLTLRYYTLESKSGRVIRVNANAAAIAPLLTAKCGWTIISIEAEKQVA